GERTFGHMYARPEVTDWLTAIGTVGAVVLVLFKDWVYAWWKRPQLEVRFTPSRQCFHKTTGGVPAKDLFYYRLQVANTGRSAARNVEVFARAVYRQTSTGAWADVARFLPEWLSWATVR